MYLLAQYFVARRGGEPDWTFANLPRIYEEIETVNACFFKRIVSIGVEDAMANVLVQLDSYANRIHILLSEACLGDLEGLFASYLGE